MWVDGIVTTILHLYWYLIQVCVGDCVQINDRLFIGRSIQKIFKQGIKPKKFQTDTGSELKQKLFKHSSKMRIFRKLFITNFETIVTPPTAKLKFNVNFVNDTLNWKQVYSLPYRVASDTKTPEFQYKLLNRCLVTNTSWICKLSIIIPSPARSLCGESDESLEHLFLSCHYTKNFWSEIKKWLVDRKVKIEIFQTKIYRLVLLDERTRYLWIIFYYWQNKIYNLVNRTNILPPLEFLFPKYCFLDRDNDRLVKQ